MLKVFITALFCCWLCVSNLAVANPAENIDKIFWARVVHVPDGDTLEAVCRTDTLDMIKIRLYGLDAPESGQEHGKKAARDLRKLINKKIVLVEIVRRKDRYGRIVGMVRLEGEDVGLMMAEAGNVWVEPRYCKRDDPCRAYWAAVRRAQKSKSGLWAGQAVAPWKWR